MSDYTVITSAIARSLSMFHTFDANWAWGLNISPCRSGVLMSVHIAPDPKLPARHLLAYPLFQHGFVSPSRLVLSDRDVYRNMHILFDEWAAAMAQYESAPRRFRLLARLKNGAETGNLKFEELTGPTLPPRRFGATHRELFAATLAELLDESLAVRSVSIRSSASEVVCSCEVGHESTQYDVIDNDPKTNNPIHLTLKELIDKCRADQVSNQDESL